MSYYTDYVVECDALTFDRLVEYWKKHDWEDYALSRPTNTWKYIGKDVRYLMYFSMNHGPYMSEVEEFLESKIGVDYKRFSLKSKGEDAEEWDDCGALKSLGGIQYRVYNDDTEDVTPVSEGFKEYEYCDIAINPMFWEDYEIDYTLDEMPKEMSGEMKVLIEISETLKDIRDILEYMKDKE